MMARKWNYIIAAWFLAMSFIAFWHSGVFESAEFLARCESEDCSALQKTIYGRFLGLPTDFMGGIGYGFVGLMSLFSGAFYNFGFLKRFTIAIREMGMAFIMGIHSYLIYVMLAVAGFFCPFCLMMFVLASLGVGASFFNAHETRRGSKGFSHILTMLFVVFLTGNGYSNIQAMNESMAKSEPKVESTIEDIFEDGEGNEAEPIEEKTMTIYLFQDLTCTGCGKMRKYFIPALQKLPYLDIVEREVTYFSTKASKYANFYVQIAKLLGVEKEVKDAIYENLETWLPTENPYTVISHLMSDDDIDRLKKHPSIKAAIQDNMKAYQGYGLKSPPGIVLEYEGGTRVFDDERIKFQQIIDVIEILNTTSTNHARKEGKHENQ